MRAPVDSLNLRTFMRELGRLSGAEGRAYLTGGATSVLLGWRETTMDVDLKIERGHRKDLADVRNMMSTGLVEPARLLRCSIRSSRSCCAIPPSHRPTSAAPSKLQ